jgi:hypothetical protein
VDFSVADFPSAAVRRGAQQGKDLRLAAQGMQVARQAKQVAVNAIARPWEADDQVAHKTGQFVRFEIWAAVRNTSSSGDT